MAIKREFTQYIELTPKELAFEFSNMNDTGQAIFFNELAKFTEKWEKPFCFQLQYIIDNKALTHAGRMIMEAIGDYGRINDIEKDAKRFQWIVNNIDYKPNGYDGSPYNRFDLWFVTDTDDLREAIDKLIANESSR